MHVYKSTSQAETLQELHEESKGEPPIFLKESIQVLRQRGLQDESLFSGCAEGRKVQLLIRAWDQGHNPLRVAKIQDCHAVSRPETPPSECDERSTA